MHLYYSFDISDIEKVKDALSRDTLDVAGKYYWRPPIYKLIPILWNSEYRDKVLILALSLDYEHNCCEEIVEALLDADDIDNSTFKIISDTQMVEIIYRSLMINEKEELAEVLLKKAGNLFNWITMVQLDYCAFCEHQGRCSEEIVVSTVIDIIERYINKMTKEQQEKITELLQWLRARTFSDGKCDNCNDFTIDEKITELL
jgi:hypothetical protein